MKFLLFLSILTLTLCDDKPLIGYIQIDNKLLTNIIGNSEKPIEIQVGIKELFGIMLATTSPLRWYLYTPETYPYILCKQKIVDKNVKTDEVVQLFGCKMPYKGESFIAIGLGTSDTRVKSPRKIHVRITVNATVEMHGPNLTEPVPKDIPTIPLPKEVDKSKIPKEEPEKNRNNQYGYPFNRDNDNKKEKEKEKERERQREKERKEKEKEKEKESNPYEDYQRNYMKRMQDYFKNMRDEFGDDDYYDDDYWSPNRYRSRPNNRSPFGNNRGFPYDSFYDDDDYYL